MEYINVVAGVVYDGDKILITKRSGGEFDGMWEVPGGKIESGETHREALERELMEELSICASMEQYLMTLTHQYETFHLTMHLYWTKIVSGTLTLNEHSDFKWISQEELEGVNWVPADVVVVERIIESNFL